MIHVLDYNGQIVDFISRDDNSVIRAVYNRDSNNDTLDITVLSARAEHFKKRNRVLIQDQNEVYREYIIERAEEDDGYLEVECTASYLLDIATSKPIPAGKYEKKTINQKLSETLRDSGWVVGDCDYAGVKTNSWTSVRTPLEMISQLETAHEVKADYEIVIDGYEVVERRVNMRKPNPLFKGKEIVYGKDLLNMKRIVDYSEVKTALYAFGPETEGGTRIETIVVDDEAQEQFNLPYRYIWGIYEPETEDEDMTLKRLTTLARTELNKRKSAALSYEISVVDLENEFPHETIRFGDIVRIKNPDFTPALYAESEVVGIEHDLISDDCTYDFGKVVEFEEDDLFKYFRSKLDYINQKLNDGFTNVNTIIKDTLDNELQYFEQKILKGTTPPDNPVNDLLWLDTSNPNVAVLRRYWNGEWLNATAENAGDVGAITREQALYSELNNTFINLSIQHSKLMTEVTDVLSSEYLVDSKLYDDVQTRFNDTILIFEQIKSSLESMTSETATIGKLIDTQALFLEYRKRMQNLYNAIENAKIAIDKRFKLLQSQYTDEKFNEAMHKVAMGIGGTWNEQSGLLIADVPDRTELENALQEYIQGQTQMLHKMLAGEVDSKIKIAKDELSSNITAVSNKVDGLSVGGRNLLPSFKNDRWEGAGKVSDYGYIKNDYEIVYLADANPNIRITLYLEPNTNYVYTHQTDNTRYYIDKVHDNGSTELFVYNSIGGPEIRKFTTDNHTKYRLRIDTFSKKLDQERKIWNLKLEKGNIPTDWTPAPEDIDNQIKPIAATQTQQSTDIKQLKDSITLKADKKEVATLYDNNIKPLETKVNDNKAQLQIQADSINSKVSQQLYNANMSNVISRLDSSDSERKQLSNAINDRVTIKEYIDNKIATDNEINQVIDDVDKSKAETEQTLNVMQTQINQNGTDINARATKEEFNASRKTLSQVIADLTVNTTTGLTLSYDENGAIDSFNVGPDGVKIDTKKFVINDGDVVVENGKTSIKDAYIDKLFSKKATINYLNSVDITAKRLQAVDNKATVSVEGGSITMNRSDGTKLDLSIDGIAMYNSGGSKRFSIDSTLVTSAALGTSNANVYLGTGGDFEARVVDSKDLPSDGYIDSYTFRPLRASGFYGNFWNINTAKSMGEPAHLYARPLSGGELRVTLNGTQANYQNFRADGIFGNFLETNTMQGNSSNLFLRPLSDGEVRVTQKGSTSNFRPVRASHFMLEGEGIGDNTPNNSYLGTNKEWRFTSNQFYNGGNTTYRDIRFKNWKAMSSERFKYDISEWKYSVLDAFRHDLKLYRYKNISEKDDDYVPYHHGVIIEREIPIEWRNGDGFDGNEVIFWNTKAIQELIYKVDQLEKELEELKDEDTSRPEQSD